MIPAVLLIGTLIASLIGGAFFATAKSAIHEIEAGISFLIAAVLFGSAAVVDAVNRLRNTLPHQS
jgi:hypothetical protein